MVVWQWDNTDPFGNNQPNENPSGVGQFNFPLRFPGQYADRETNTYYNVNRDYDPSIGRYIESDPIGLWGGINTYIYVGGNPLAWTDSLGLSPGHHEFPQQFWRKSDIPLSAQKVFDQATIAPAGRHGWSKAHSDYSKNAGQQFKTWCETNKVDPSKMTSNQAEAFLNSLRKDPEILRYNNLQMGPQRPIIVRGVGALMIIDVILQVIIEENSCPECI